MASVNKVILIGALGRDPEARQTQSGALVVNLSVATSRKFKDIQGQVQEETEWHRISAFGKVAEIINQYLKKGHTAYFEGRLHTREYTDKEGIKRYQTEIICESMQMLGGGSGSRPQQNPDIRANGVVRRQPIAHQPSRLTVETIPEDTPF